jgi:hypothetical protein
MQLTLGFGLGRDSHIAFAVALDPLVSFRFADTGKWYTLLVAGDVMRKSSVYRRGSCPRKWCTSRELRFGWTRAQLTTADSRAG